MLALLLILALFTQPEAAAPAAPPLPELLIDRDNIAITQSCRVRIPDGLYLPDPDNNGVIHVAADNITIQWPAEAPGREMLARDGASDGTDPHETFTGIGIRIDGHSNVTIRGAHIHRYKHAIWATNADNLTLENCDLSDGYAMRLGSTPAAENSADWLWPHANDNNEWATNYGGAIWIENSKNITVAACFARRTQNALLLENVTDSRIYDNDFSFLSGWGIAMWRSSRNTISRNALDFCIRGYSHAVYNRGQDSAGILLFEQCNHNLFIANSATHGGDGLFGFGGKEALGDTPAPETDADGNPWSYTRRGCNDNFFALNDFSYAAAHGLELTFSFGNQIQQNRFDQNAICGIWGGYSQDTIIINNQFSGNGTAGYGLERGGVNIEHSERNSIVHNHFSQNAAGIHLWHDADTGLMSGPWAKANHEATRDNVIMGNRFDGDNVAIHLRAVESTLAANNQFAGVDTPIKAEPAADGTPSEPTAHPSPTIAPGPLSLETLREVAYGHATPVGARANLAGRHNIIMGDYFPWDHDSPMLRRGPDVDGTHTYELLGVTDASQVDAVTNFGTLHFEAIEPRPPAFPDNPSMEGIVMRGPPPYVRITVSPEPDSDITAYTLSLSAPIPASVPGVIVHSRWDVRAFRSPVDPREDLTAWRAGADNGIRDTFTSLKLRFGHDGPTNLRGEGFNLDETRDAAPTSDHFGTIATTTLRLPPGRWRITTLSDDGIRVIVNNHTILENWTHHGPTQDSAEFEVVGDPDAQPVETRITVEHFELDGYAILELEIEPLP